MTTDTSTKVANRALLLIGQSQTLTDLDTDTSTAAYVIKAVYADCLDTVLQAGDWNFNAVRAELPEYDTTPAFDFAYQYALPADCLRTRELYDAGSGVSIYTGYQGEVRDDRARWRVETVGATDDVMQRVILCNIGPPLKVVYSRKVYSLPRWSPLAIEALIALLASRIAMPISQKQSTVEMALGIYRDTIASAMGRDAQEGSGTVLDEGSWVSARW